MVSVDQDHVFPGQHLLQLGIGSSYLTVISRVPCTRVVCCVATLQGTDCSIIDLFHPMIVEQSLWALNRFIQHHATYLLQNLPQISSSMSWILVKISHITMDFVVLPASDRINVGLGPQLLLPYMDVWTRPTGVWMVSVDQDHAFPGHHLLQLDTRSGCLTVVSRVPRARVVCCAARLDGKDCSIIDPFSSNGSRDVFLGF